MADAVPRRFASCIAGFLAPLCFLLAAQSAPTQSPVSTIASTSPSQKDPIQLPVFDVASIKQHESNDGMIRAQGTADGLSIKGMPMHLILREALGVTNDRLMGEPAWANSDRYDVDANVAPDDAPNFRPLKPEQRWSMLIPVLKDRCALKFHHETKELTVYALVVAKGGVKMQPSKPKDPAANLDARKARATGPEQMKAATQNTGLTMTGREASTEGLAHELSGVVGSTVIDKTGLTGNYDYTLQFAPDENMRAGLPPPPSSASAPSPEPEGPSIFAAVQEQLGLKLVAQKEPVDVIVIDNFARPSEN